MKFKKILRLLITVVIASFLFSFSCYARDIPVQSDGSFIDEEYSRYYTNFTKNTKIKTGEHYILTGKLTLRKDTTLVSDSTLYLKKGSSLIIKDGARFTAYGGIVIERGAKLYVTNGSFVSEFIFENYGKLIIRENGKLYINNGKYISNAASEIKLEGDMLFGKTSLADTVARIKKYDDKFSLNSYCMNCYSVGTDKLTLNYCIGETITDYRYSAYGKNISRKGYSLEKVYSEEINKKVKNTAEEFLRDRNTAERFGNDKYLFALNYGFSYNYKKEKLVYTEQYFEFGIELAEMPEAFSMVFERYYDEKVDLGV